MQIKNIFFLLLFWAWTMPTASATVYAVVAAIDNYVYQRKLNCTRNDANDFYAYLTQPDGLQLPNQNVTLLLDEQATNEAMLQAMAKQFEKATESDVVILFFSGHGGIGYFCTYDGNGNGGRLYHSDIKKVFQGCRAKVKICFADACHAGSLLQPTQVGLVFQTATAADFDSQVAVFMSCRTNETSLESGKLQRGVFTYYLLKGLKGRADADSDKQISLAELFAYTHKNVVHYAQTKYNHSQHPTLTGRFDAKMLLIQLK
jgi:uncharacterized caspase-like protein